MESIRVFFLFVFFCSGGVPPGPRTPFKRDAVDLASGAIAGAGGVF